MNIFKRYNYKKILLSIMWVAIASAGVALLVAAVHKKEEKLCKGVEINISGVSNNFFIDKDEVKKIITSYAGDDISGTPIKGFNLVGMEAALKKEVWIKNAELFFDNNEVLQASVEEREPAARIFTVGGNSFYIDNTKMILPLSNKISARLPVFTNFPSENKVLSRADSNLLEDIKTISQFIQRDSFLMAMIDQVDITSQRSFEMIPKIGDQIIVFGDATDIEQKFNKLRLFYKKVITKYGWSRYSIINLQYKGQVVAKIKGKDDVSADSLRTEEIMHAIAINTSRQASDSLQMIMQDNDKNTTDVTLIQQSIQRDDEGDEPLNAFEKYPAQQDVAIPVKAVVIPAVKPVVKAVVPPVKKTALKPIKPVVKTAAKPIIKPKPKPVKPVIKATEKPKVVMPKKNDY